MASTIWKKDNMPIRVDISLSSPPNTPVYCVTVSGNPKTSDALKKWHEESKFWANKAIRILSVNKDTFIVLAETPKCDRNGDLEKVMKKMFDHLAGKMGKGLMVDQSDMPHYDRETALEADIKYRESLFTYEEKEIGMKKKFGVRKSSEGS